LKLSLVWQGGLKFSAGPGGAPIALESSTPGVLSPVQTLGYAVAACMAMDVADILVRGRHDLQALSVSLDATRAAEPPRRILSIDLGFDVRGDVPEGAVARAIDLSREKLCSVWHSMRQDIQLQTTFAVRS
jgi:putative redox protein